MAKSDADPESSVLRDAVHGHIKRSGLTLRQAADQTGVSESAIRGLGKNDALGPQDGTLERLAELGFSFDELARMRSADIVARYGNITDEWDADTMRVAMRVARMTPGRRRLMIGIAELIRFWED